MPTKHISAPAASSAPWELPYTTFLVRLRCAHVVMCLQVKGRQLQRHGGAFAKGGQLITAPLPLWLSQLSSKVHTELGSQFFCKPPSHVLVNSYQPGQGILPHADGPCYKPHVAILSLGSASIFRFYPVQRDSTGRRDQAALSTEQACGSSAAAAAAASCMSGCSFLQHRTGAEPAEPPTQSFACEQACSQESSGHSLQLEVACNLTCSTGGRHGMNNRTKGKACSDRQPCISVVLPPRSLLAFRGDLYDTHLHGVDAVERERVDQSVVNPDAALEGEALRYAALKCGTAKRCRSHEPQPDGSSNSSQTFQRSGERISLTFRNAAREVHVFSNPSRRL